MNVSIYRLIESALELEPALSITDRETILACCRTPHVFSEKSKPPTERLLNTNQVAELLGVSRSTIWRMTKSGALRPVNIIGSPRYRQSDIFAIIEN